MASENARRLRRGMTDAERKLWSLLRRKQLQGFRFAGKFHSDLTSPISSTCPRLVIELDGGQHVGRAQHDQRRTAWLADVGYRVLRFWNGEVFTNTEGVLETIRLALLDPPPQPSPSRGGGRSECGAHIPLPLAGEG